jgi:hypothetical protein
VYRCLSFFFDHCDVCPSSIYRFWLPLWYLLTIVVSVLLRFRDYDYPFGIFWPLCCLSFFDLQIMITPLVFLTIVVSILLRFRDYDYPFGIFWPLWCLSFFDLEIMITLLVSFDHCGVCPSSIYRLWLPLWYLQTLLIKNKTLEKTEGTIMNWQSRHFQLKW